MAFAVGSAAWAQEAPQQAAAASSDDIVVTARRREESLQSVPVSVSVATPEMLKEQRIVTAQDIQNLAPSLTVTSRSGQQQSGAFNIRGQGQTFGGSLPSVITYLSEVPLDSNGGAAFALYDIDSIQVLRGPQGTLFGRNTNGGAVLITPTAPGTDFGGYVDVSYGNLDYVEVKGAVNLPIAEGVSLRLAGNMIRRDGYVKNLLGRDFSDQHQDSWRAFLRLQPTDTLTIDTVYSGLDADEGGSAYILSAIRPGKTAASFQGGALVAGLAQQEIWGPRVVANAEEGLGATRNVQLISNTIKLDLGDITIKNIAAYERVKVCYGTDLDGTDVRNSYTSCFQNRYADAAGIKMHPDTNLRQFTEELQLSGSAMNERLDYIAGAFYLRGESPGGLNTFRAIRAAYSAASPTTINSNFSTAQFRDESKAVFAQATAHLGADKELSITAGLRYTWDKRTSSFGRIVRTNPINTPPPLSAYTCTLPGVGTSATTAPLDCYRINTGQYEDVGYNFSVDYKVTPELLLYATTRRGFKDGGFNVLLASANDPEYQPETVTDYEVGAKWTFRTGPVSGRLNVDVFTSKYKGIQRQITGGTPPTALIVNVGEGTIKGVEAEGLLRSGPFSISGFVAYLDAKYNGGFIDGGVNVSDSKFIGVPKLSGGVTVRGEQEIGSEGDLLVASMTYYGTLRYAIESNNVLNFEGFAPGYSTLSARLEWRNVRGSTVDLALWGKNITNKLYVQGGVPQGNSSGITSYLYGEPRTYGLQAIVHF